MASRRCPSNGNRLMLNSAFAVAFRVSIRVEVPSGWTRSTTPFFLQARFVDKDHLGYQPVASSSAW